MNRVWTWEIGRALGWVAFGGLVGLVFSQFWLGVALALCIPLARHVRNLARLRVWLDQPKQVDLGEPKGVWDEIFTGLVNLQRQNRKRKKRLAAILAEFQSSTEALPDGAVVLGARGEISWFNKSAQALLGLRLPQDLGLRVPNLIRKPVFTEYFAKGDFSAEVEAPSPVNDQIILSYRVIPYGNRQQLLIVRDVSELKRLELSRREFVANASHELRTPLTVFRGYLDMMEADMRSSGPGLTIWQMPIGEMRAQAVRMEALVNDLLKLARLESDVIQTRQDMLDVPRMLERIREEALAISQGKHRIVTSFEPGLCLFGRETEIHSVFSNLIGNAIQYTPAGGIIEIRWYSDEEGAHFSVADSGIGIEPKDIPRLTERFYRVDVGRSRASGGTGLGLSIVQQALVHHEGRMQVESEPAVGSTFTCHFPPHRVHRQNATTAAAGKAA